MTELESNTLLKHKTYKKMFFEKAYGTLLGVAYGDAFGMPTSLWNPEMIHKNYPDGVNELLPAPKGHLIHNGMFAGQVTDDTQQTLLLADQFIEEKKFTREGIAKRLLAWAKSLNAFESMILGPSSLKALKMIEDGIPLELTGSMGETNGAAMKITPVGIVHPGDYDAVIEDVAEVCLPTHNTSTAISGASAVACAVSAGMAGGNIDSLIDAALYGANQGLKLGNQWYGASIEKRIEFAIKLVSSKKCEKEIWQDLYDYIGSGVAITESVPTAIALVYYYKGNPLLTAYGSANMGGDCDTVGAIAGGIAGSFSGVHIFPEKIIQKLSSVNKIDFKKYAENITDIMYE